jgi:stage V sporulation protein B
MEKVLREEKIKQNSKQEIGKNFFAGIVALMSSQIVIKILGMIYSLYLTNKDGFGDSGNAIYMSGYQIFALFLTVSSMGVPTAISKLVSEKIAAGNVKGADKIFKVALIFFGILGFIETVFLFCSSKFIANSLLEIPQAEFSLMFLSPAIFFVSLSSVMEGYFLGRKEIKQTAKVKVFEQFLKMIFIIVIVEFISNISGKNTEYMAAAANFASSMATMISCIYLEILCIRMRKLSYNKFKIFKQDSAFKIIFSIIKVSVPLAIGSLLIAVNKNIDSITVVRILKDKIGEEAAKQKYGILTSKIDVILAVPLSLNAAFSIALIPEIAGAKIKNKMNDAEKKLEISLLISITLAIPCMVGIFIFSNEIINLLFPKANTGAELLKMSAFVILFEILTQTMSGALQGLGKIKLTTIILFLGTITKLISNIVFLKFSNLLEKGAIAGNICCYAVIFLFDLYFLKRNCNIKFNMKKFVIKPFLASAIMGILAINFNKLLISVNLNNNLCTIISIIFAIIIYIILIFKLHIFSDEELKFIGIEKRTNKVNSY